MVVTARTPPRGVAIDQSSRALGRVTQRCHSVSIRISTFATPSAGGSYDVAISPYAVDDSVGKAVVHRVTAQQPPPVSVASRSKVKSDLLKTPRA